MAIQKQLNYIDLTELFERLKFTDKRQDEALDLVGQGTVFVFSDVGVHTMVMVAPEYVAQTIGISLEDVLQAMPGCTRINLCD
jgi:hypothetical protein